MPYTLGSTTAPLSGNGQIAVADLVGVRVNVTAIPDHAGSRVANPIDWFGLGHLTPGDANGWDANLPIVHSTQLFYPLRDGISVLGYSLTVGVTATLQLLTGQLSAARALPWDRNAATWSRGTAATHNGGAGELVAWTYTVPAGRKLWLASLTSRVTRTVVASSTLYGAYGYIMRTGETVSYASLMMGAVGAVVVDQLGGNLVMLPGETLSARAGNYDTGGTVSVFLSAAGLLFDA